MSLDNMNTDPEDMRDIEQFAFNNNLFRNDVTFHDFGELRRIKFEELQGKLGWKNYIYGLMPVVFIDLLHVLRYLYFKNKHGFSRPGLSAINVKTIADIVCDFMGMEDEFHELLWASFDEEVASAVIAELGLDDLNGLIETPFETAMEAVVEIANIVQRYLINAGYPLVDFQSVYKVHDVKNGILALRLRTYEELEKLNGG